MVDRINPNHARNADTINSPNRGYQADFQASANPRPLDDVIAHLANAQENRRARQVSEWESLQRQSRRVAL